jgi:uncharacterized protein YjiS (DUF1127 family)
MSNHILSLIPRSALGHSVAHGIAPALARAVEAPIDWIARMRDRQQLAALSDDMLKDIGVSRADAEHEFEKHFWQA